MKINLFFEKFNEILNAEKRIREYIIHTPLLEIKDSEEYFNNRVYLKLENLQVTNAAKVRGAFNKLLRINSDTIVAASSGSHGIGISYAAKKLGHSAIIIMPTNTPRYKVEKVRQLGGEVILYGEDYYDAHLFGRKLARQKNLFYCHAFDDWDIITGNGTIGVEIMRDYPDLDVIIIPIGGGGLIAGISIAIKNINPSVKVIGVEAKGAPSMLKALRYNKPVSLKNISTIADAIAVKRVGKITYEIVKKTVDKIITVTDKEIINSLRFLVNHIKVISEPAGAASVAGLFKLKNKLMRKNIACLISGGNISGSELKKFLRCS